MLRGKFTAIQAFLKKEEKSEVNNLIYHLKELEKEEQTNPGEWKEGNHKDQRENKSTRFKKKIEKNN